MVNTKENKKLNKDALDMQKYRNDYKYAKEHKLIPKIPMPNWMKQSSRLKKSNTQSPYDNGESVKDLISKEKFQDDGK